MAKTLSPDDLYRRCDPKMFPFGTTGDLPALDGIIGQQRALDAIDFGLNLRSTGFNIYVLGDSGTGKTSAIRSFLSKKAGTEIVPPDWCYVHNFRAPADPVAIRLEPGRGIAGIHRLPEGRDSEGLRVEGIQAAEKRGDGGIPEEAEGAFRGPRKGGGVEGLQDQGRDGRILHRGHRHVRGADDGGGVQRARPGAEERPPGEREAHSGEAR
jgi:hypothetical protein